MKRSHDKKVKKAIKDGTWDPKVEMVGKPDEDAKMADDDDDDEEEEKKAPAAPAAPEKKKEEAKKPSMANRAINFKCRNCAKAMNGFQCDENTRHVVCAACKGMFPISNQPGVEVQCIACRSYYCNQHWKCNNVGRNKVNQLVNMPFVGVTANTFNKNTFEQKVLGDYMKKKGWNANQLKVDMLTRCENAGDWQIEDDLGIHQNLSKNSGTCKNCAGKIWDTILYNYRRAINNELPPAVKNRSNCWYGIQCRTMGHNYGHASKLNHVCPNTRR